MGVVRPGSPVHAWHCQPKAVCVGEVPRQRPGPSSNVQVFLSRPTAPWKGSRVQTWGGGAGRGEVRGPTQKRLKVFSQPSLSSQAPPCWLPTLLAFAHSLAMRKPSAEAREKVRFLWTVARSDLGTLDRQGRW